MSETLFIADLHLHPQQPAILELFFKFLNTRASQAAALYIIGDLFEAWVGDDEDIPAYLQVTAALQALTQQGVAVYVMHGNRDFLIGTDFAQQTGCQLLDDPSVIDLYGTPTLVMHGDTLCTQDVAYQAFRQQVRNPAWQQFFLAQSLEQRRLMAQQARAQSQSTTQNTAEEIMDVTPEAVVDIMQTHGVSRLIHGHTHRPAVHDLAVNGQAAQRYVVGNWQADSALIVHCDSQRCALVEALH